MRRLSHIAAQTFIVNGESFTVAEVAGVIAAMAGRLRQQGIVLRRRRRARSINYGSCPHPPGRDTPVCLYVVGFAWLQAPKPKGVGCTIRLPTNRVLHDKIGYLPNRRIGRASHEVRCYARFSYRTGCAGLKGAGLRFTQKTKGEVCLDEGQATGSPQTASVIGDPSCADGPKRRR